jgi:hypothetical protein
LLSMTVGCGDGSFCCVTTRNLVKKMRCSLIDFALHFPPIDKRPFC